MNIKQIIGEKLKEASLSEFEVSLWSEVLDNMNEKELQAVFDFIQFDNNALRVATDNLVAKTEAWDSGDLKKWTIVLENEKSLIQSI
jgi:hypothetical protein